MTLGEITDELQKYCNMGFSQEEVSVVNNSFSRKNMTMNVKIGKRVTIIFNDREEEKMEKAEKKEVKKERAYKGIAELLHDFPKAVDNQFLISMPHIWIKNRFTDEVEMITGFCYANSFHSDDKVETSTRTLTMDDLFKEYRFLDGSICGIRE